MLSLISSVGSANNPTEIPLDQDTIELLVETEITSFLDSYDTQMKRLVAGEIDLPYWTPSATYIPIETREFITNLKIPRNSSGKPLSPQHVTTSDGPFPG